VSSSVYTHDAAAHDVEQRARRDGATLLWAQALRTLVEGAGTLLLVRVLTPAAFGLIDMVVAVTGLIDLLKDFGLSAATIQKEHIEPAQISALFWINCAVGVVLSAFSAALAPLIALGYARPELRDLTLALALCSMLGALGVQHQALLKRALRFRTLAAIELWSAALSTLVAVVGAYRGWGAWALVARQLVRLAIQTALSFAWSDLRVLAPRRADVRELLAFGSHVSGFQVMNYLERNLDNMLVGRFAGAEQLAFYAKAYEMMRLPLQHITGPVAVIALPALSRLAHAPERYRHAYVQVARVLMLISIPLAPVAILSADVLVPLVLGPHWSGSVPMFRYLGLALLVKPLANTTSWLFLSQGRSRELWQWSLIGTPLAALSFVIGLPWGALGVAIAYTTADLFVRTPILFWLLARSGPIRLRDLFDCLWPAWITALGATLVYVALVQLLPAWPQQLRVLLSIPLALVAGASVLLLRAESRAVLREAWRTLRGLQPRFSA
jgi:PST family polysaccharide transporter